VEKHPIINLSDPVVAKIKRSIFLVTLVILQLGCSTGSNAPAYEYNGKMVYPPSNANWYVRPSGGSESGTSWTAAWNGLNGIDWSAVSCSDTIWVAGGTYDKALVPNKDCSGNNRLHIRRARVDAMECVGADGWKASFDDTINHTASPAISFSYGYTNRNIMISGRSTANPGHWAGYGWYLNMKGITGGTATSFVNGKTDDVTLEYMEAEGPGVIYYTSEGTAIDLLQYSGTNTNLLISHWKIHGFSSGIYMCGVPINPIFEYIDMYNNRAENASSYHPDGWYSCGINGFTVRYSKLHGVTDSAGFAHEGIFHGNCGGTTWIYGNQFYDQTDSTAKSIETNPNSYPSCTLKILNNTFYNVYNPIWNSHADCLPGSEVRNNIFYNCTGRVDSCGTASNNLRINSPNPFVNANANDFHIISTTGTKYPRNAGMDLSGYFRTDGDGVPFGGDGAWDIGAYEYNGKMAYPPNTSGVR